MVPVPFRSFPIHNRYINDFKRYFKQVVVGFQKQPEDEWSFQSSDVGD